MPKGLGGRSLIGGITGGISAEIYGGDFGQGFVRGAETAAMGYLFNDLFHENTAAASGLHRRVVVRDDNGNSIFGFSFGMANDDQNPFTDNFSQSGAAPSPWQAGNGMVYVDATDPATKVVDRFITTTREDSLIVNYMTSRVNDTAPYNAFTNSCRTFSANEFNYIRNEILRARSENRDPIFR